MKRVRKENYINKIVKSIIISLILVVIYELIMRFLLRKNPTIFIYNVILETLFVSFGLFHFTIGIKKLYGYIIDNRYRLSIILIIISTILGFFGNYMRY